MSEISVKRINSLFLKIFVVAIICMIVPMLVSLVYVIYSSSNYIEAQTKSSLLDSANEKAQQIDSSFNDLLIYVKSITNEPYTINFLKEVSATNQTDPIKQKRLSENLAQKFNNANGLYENIFIIYNRTVLSDCWSQNNHWLYLVW